MTPEESKKAIELYRAAKTLKKEYEEANQMVIDLTKEEDGFFDMNQATQSAGEISKWIDVTNKKWDEFVKAKSEFKGYMAIHKMIYKGNII